MKTNTTFKIFGFILAISVLLFGGMSITGAAAQSAIPGDALYPVKTTIENTRLSFAQDAGDRAQMKLTFAEQRLTEISGLIGEGRYRELREAVLAFEANINAALMELKTVSASDPSRAASITQEVTSALTRYAQTLSELAAVAPDSIRPEVDRALDTTQIASGLGQVSGNENANSNDNGSIDDNANVNANDNGSVDDNSNDDNSNADDNGNANNSVDDNPKDDVDGNSNDNSSDDNSNSSVDDNSNASVEDNANDNGSVDDNSSGGDNSNDDSSGGNSGSDDNGGKGKGGDD